MPSFTGTVQAGCLLPRNASAPSYSGALELDLATLHTRAKDYLPNVSKAELRSTLGPGPFTLEQLQQLLSKRSEQVLHKSCASPTSTLSRPDADSMQGQGRDFQQQYATYLSAKAGKGSAADAVARQLEGWQDIGTVSRTLCRLQLAHLCLPYCIYVHMTQEKVGAGIKGGPRGSAQLHQQSGSRSHSPFLH